MQQAMSMVAPSITMTYGSILGLMFVFLSVNVAINRGKTKVLTGTGPNDEIAGIVRAQENFAEYVPFALLLLAGLEMSAGVGDTWLRVFGGTLIVSRALHAWGLYSTTGESAYRAIGAGLTWLIIAAMSIWGLVVVLG